MLYTSNCCLQEEQSREEERQKKLEEQRKRMEADQRVAATHFLSLFGEVSPFSTNTFSLFYKWDTVHVYLINEIDVGW